MPEVRLIDANAAADKIMRETENRADDLNMIGIALMIGITKMLRDENDFPTIEAEPVRHGHWIECTSRGSYSIYCSYCGSHKETICQSEYCPTCGARMDESQEEEENES